ncbi:pyocin knob domain-containing S74 family peptidase, partial [Klebsiella michiganensis]
MLVPKTTTVNGKALSENITLTKTDVGLGNVTNDLQLKAASNLSDLNNVATARGNLGLTALGLGGTPTTLSTMDWLTQLFVVGGLYVVAAGGMTNVPADLIFEDATTITMIRVVATDGTFLTCEVWPSTSTASKFRMYNVRFTAGTTSNRTFWVRQIFDNSGVIPVINGGTGATTAAAARTNLGFGTVATYNIGTSGETIPLLSTANTWSSNQSIQGNLSVGAPAQTSTINLGGSSFSRDNGTSALIITSNSGTTSGSAGLYLRPMGDTVSTVQLYGNSTGWTFQGALNASSTLRVNGATTLSGSLAVTGESTFSGSYNGNRAAIDLTGSTTDLNSCFVAATSSGHEQVWICTTQGGGTNITNKPPNITGSFWLQSASTRINGVADSGYVQTLYSYETSRTYVRYGKSTSATGGNWSAWSSVATTEVGNTWNGTQTFNLRPICQNGISSGFDVIASYSSNNSPATGDFVTSGQLKAVLKGRGGQADSDGAFFKMYMQERVGTNHYGLLNLNGFGNDRNWFFNVDGTTVSPNGTLQVQGSDVRLKENFVQAEEGAAERISKIGTVEFNFRGQERTQRGFVAQQMQQIDNMYTFYGGENTDVDGNNFTVLNLDNIAVLADLVTTVQEQMKAIAELKEQIQQLKNK